MLAVLNVLLVLLSLSDAFKDLDYLRKIVKTQPTISNSLVNLGKIDVSIFVPHKKDVPMVARPLPELNHPFRKMFFPALVHPPPMFHPNPNVPPHPEVFKKLFLNNDLFSMGGDMDGFTFEHPKLKPEFILFPNPHASFDNTEPFEEKSTYKIDDSTTIDDKTDSNELHSNIVHDDVVPSLNMKTVKSNEVNDADVVVTPTHASFN